MVHGPSASLKFADLGQVPWLFVLYDMDLWAKTHALQQEIRCMNTNLENYKRSWKEAQAENEVSGYKQRLPFFFLFLGGLWSSLVRSSPKNSPKRKWQWMRTSNWRVNIGSALQLSRALWLQGPHIQRSDLSRWESSSLLRRRQRS